MSEPKYVAETLAWCNARRKERGKRPLKRLPKGVLHDAASCPCGKATGLHVYQDEAVDYHPEDGRYDYIPITEAVTRFVADFDEGRLPQYEAKA